ncbi:PREDICTED: uncharacterized protein LOC105561869 [Vollenhovia emeryi]|uniref:uncharacterized protein LOC105561869 n=1 Tax=Vollenhovia emeryi TaxID=411798 RepID=UPI0005F50999|nr:PREDICTED: uncharacterized protein LOC105561869 [Vollenhovia emeryi]
MFYRRDIIDTNFGRDPGELLLLPRDLKARLGEEQGIGGERKKTAPPVRNLFSAFPPHNALDLQLPTEKPVCFGVLEGNLVEVSPPSYPGGYPPGHWVTPGPTPSIDELCHKFTGRPTELRLPSRSTIPSLPGMPVTGVMEQVTIHWAERSSGEASDSPCPISRETRRGPGSVQSGNDSYGNETRRASYSIGNCDRAFINFSTADMSFLYSPPND